MNTHISYETAKKLKEFLGVSAPEPIAELKWWRRPIKWTGKAELSEFTNCVEFFDAAPAYQLHDLLGKPFCDAFCVKTGESDWDGIGVYGLCHKLADQYLNGGLPAVEKALEEMMK